MSHIREFKIALDETDLNACKAAGVDPEAFVKNAAREAIAALVEPAADDEPEEDPVAEETETDEEEPEEDEEDARL